MIDRGAPSTVASSSVAPTAGRAFLVAVLLGSAGCGALPVATEQVTTAETMTPVPVPNASDGSTRSDGTLPPGVPADGRLDVDRLARAHADALAGTSYTETLARTVVVPDVPTTLRQFLREVAFDGNAALVDRSGTGLDSRRTTYSDPSGTYLRTETRNRTRVSALTESDRVPTPDGTVSRFLAGLDVRATSVEIRGTTFYRVVGTPSVRPHALETVRGRMTVANYTVTALVAPSGFVREMSVSYRRSTEGRPRQVRVSVEYTRLGATTVSRPAWVPVDGNATRDGSSPS